jgi:hypothetical protein
VKGRRWLGALLLVFALFFIFTQPVEAATMVRTAFDAAVRLASAAAEAFSTFLRTLF